MSEKVSIPFNKFSPVGNELEYISRAIKSGEISGNGFYTKKCHQFFESRYGFKKTLLTSSCTDALEMAALLCDLKPGDEVIIPSYTFVSTANAFLLRGAKIVFADSESGYPNMDTDKIENLITSKTKAIVPVHYAGVPCDMNKILLLAQKHNLFVVEDAAHAMDTFYNGKALGSFGHFASFSFHVTKNITCGEGGLLAINDERFIKKAEIIWEKGTNRSAFFRGETDKYGWVDIGSSFLASDISAACLYAQLEALEKIQEKRKRIWVTYYDLLSSLHNQNIIQIPAPEVCAINNGHLFFIVCKDLKTRSALIEFLRGKGVHAVFHYLSLHKSAYYHAFHDKNRVLKNSDRFTECLLRLPLFYDLTIEHVKYVAQSVHEFFRQK